MACIAVVAGVLLVLLQAVVARAEDGPTDPRHAAELMARATAAGDAGAIAALYAPNAILLAPNAPVISGRANILALHQRAMSAGKVSLEFGDIRMDAEGAAALVLWEWTQTITPASGQAIVNKGRSMVYFRRGEAGWLIVADMFQGRP